MSVTDLLARRRSPIPEFRSATANQKTAAGNEATDRAAVLHLAIYSALSVAVYYLTLVRPYSLQRLWMSHQLDLDRLQASDHNAHWFILGGLLAEALLYYLGWRAVRRIRQQGAAWIVILAGALASSIVLLYFYPLGSTDIWDYIIHGRMLALHGANPFVKVAAQYPQDIFAWYAGWPFDTSAYGPFWEVLAAVVARLAGNNVIQNVIAFKLLVTFFMFASVAVTALILRRVAPERALTGAFLVAWNPLVLYETVANGHNDIVMVFWMLIAVHAMIERRYTLAILSLLAGALVKFIPILMIPAAGLIALRELGNMRARVLFIATTAAAAIVLIVAAYQPFWIGPQVLSVARRQEMYTSSLPAALVMYLLPKMGFLAAALKVSKIAGMLTALYALFEGFRAMNDRSWHSFARSVFNISIFYLLVTCMWFWDWYAIWPLALAAILPSGHSTRLAQVFMISALGKPLVFVPLLAWHLPPPTVSWLQLRLGPAIMAASLIYLLYAFWDTILSRLQHRFGHTEPTPAYVTVSARDNYRRQERDER